MCLSWDASRNIVQTENTSTDPISSFQNHDLEPLLLEQIGSVQTGHSGTDDNDIRRGLPHAILGVANASETAAAL